MACENKSGDILKTDLVHVNVIPLNDEQGNHNEHKKNGIQVQS